MVVHLAGPIAGWLATAATLKAANIMIEYMKAKNVGTAVKKGWKKDLFNEEQPSALKGAAILHILYNGLTLFPADHYGHRYQSDGRKIWNCFLK